MTVTDRPWASMSVPDVLAAVGGSPTGLDDAEAARRLAANGPNALGRHGSGALSVLIRQFRNAVLLLLIGTAVVAAALGDVTDAVIIGVILLASVGLGFADEYAAERTTARLQESMTHRAVVIRGGRTSSIPASDVVVGDLVHLDLGCRIPADVRLTEAVDLSTDESVLSGESTASDKSTEPVPAGTAIADRTDIAFQGTVVHGGSGTGVVVATGADTEIGRVAGRLREHPPETAFQSGLRRFSMLLVWVAAALVIVVIATGALLDRPLVQSLLFALAIAVGVTPQLLPAVVNTSLAAGARRLARRKVLVKRLVCIEDLGNIEVLVTDKTGTLTTGEIEFTAALGPDGSPAPGLAALAASTVDPHTGGDGTTDALDAALLAAGAAAGGVPTASARVPFDHGRMRSSAVIPDATAAGGFELVCKGAPDAVLPQCGEVPDGAHALVEAQLAAGARLLAVATRPLGASSATTADEAGLTLRGFLVFADAPRADAAASLRRLTDLGVRVVVATGDHPAVAQGVWQRLGMPATRVLTGRDIDGWDDDALAAALRESGIVARVSPEQKERVVAALRHDKATVGFLGDGVNDALAIHAADVGISVDTATDVAKDAADVVLLEKSLDVIADGVCEGRRIFRNTIKYVFMSASGNTGNMISAAAASAFLPFLPMLPGQILLGNLFYDASQLTISSDRVDPENLARPSRWDIGAIGRFMLVFGPLSTLFDLATFALLLGVFRADPVEFRTGWFVESVASQALVVLVIRTHRFPFVRSRPGIPLLLALLGVVAVVVALPYLPFAALLGLTPLPVGLLLALAAVVVVYLVVADMAKRLFFRAEERPKPPAPNRRLERAIAGLPH